MTRRRLRAGAATLGKIALPLLVLAATSGCAVLEQGVLNAQGPVAAHERTLFWTAFFILLFVALPVFLLVPLFAWHYRLGNTKRAYRPNWKFSWPLEGFIWLPPIGIVIALALILAPATKKDDPYTRLAAAGPPLRIQAIALDWKWAFIYPDLGIATVNQIAVPVGRPVHIELTSGTVMQSMLLPQLAGQIYAMAGMRTQLNFMASKTGNYLGKNTQFNGTYFPKERFSVVALPMAGYDAWVSRVRRAPAVLDAATWQQVSQRSPQLDPLFFSRVMPNLFDRVTSIDGGADQPHHSSSSHMGSK